MNGSLPVAFGVACSSSSRRLNRAPVPGACVRSSMIEPIVDVNWLIEHARRSDCRPDVRWYLDGRSGQSGVHRRPHSRGGFHRPRPLARRPSDPLVPVAIRSPTRISLPRGSPGRGSVRK